MSNNPRIQGQSTRKSRDYVTVDRDQLEEQNPELYAEITKNLKEDERAPAYIFLKVCDKDDEGALLTEWTMDTIEGQQPVYGIPLPIVEKLSYNTYMTEGRLALKYDYGQIYIRRLKELLTRFIRLTPVAKAKSDELRERFSNLYSRATIWEVVELHETALEAVEAKGKRDILLKMSDYRENLPKKGTWIGKRWMFDNSQRYVPQHLWNSGDWCWAAEEE
jgi:flagellar biosynthesis regulator FlaF